MTEHHDTLKNTLDIVSVFATVTSFFQLISPIFGFIGAVLALMRIAEMVTGKSFTEVIRWKKKNASNE